MIIKTIIFFCFKKKSCYLWSWDRLIGKEIIKKFVVDLAMAKKWIFRR